MLSQENPDSVVSGQTAQSKGSESEVTGPLEGRIPSSPNVHSEKRTLSFRICYKQSFTNVHWNLFSMTMRTHYVPESVSNLQ